MKYSTAGMALGAAALLLAGCGHSTTDESQAPSTTVDIPASFTSAGDVEARVNNVRALLRSDAPLDEVRAYATQEYLDALMKTYQAQDLAGVQHVLSEKERYVEYDEKTQEVFHEPKVEGNVAHSTRDRTLEVHVFEAAPVRVNCEVRDTWSREDDTWKLRMTDVGDCAAKVTAEQRVANGLPSGIWDKDATPEEILENTRPVY